MLINYNDNDNDNCDLKKIDHDNLDHLNDKDQLLF